MNCLGSSQMSFPTNLEQYNNFKKNKNMDMMPEIKVTLTAKLVNSPTMVKTQQLVETLIDVRRCNHRLLESNNERDTKIFKAQLEIALAQISDLTAKLGLNPVDVLHLSQNNSYFHSAISTEFADFLKELSSKNLLIVDRFNASFLKTSIIGIQPIIKAEEVRISNEPKLDPALHVFQIKQPGALHYMRQVYQDPTTMASLYVSGGFNQQRFSSSSNSNWKNQLSELKNEAAVTIALLQSLNIKTVLSLEKNLNDIESAVLNPENIAYIGVNVDDFTTPDAYQAKKAVTAINSSLAKGESILLHCAAGIGRSSVMTAAFLISKMHYSAEYAAKIVTEGHPVTKNGTIGANLFDEAKDSRAFLKDWEQVTLTPGI